jgi:hypothetical protein
MAQPQADQAGTEPTKPEQMARRGRKPVVINSLAVVAIIGLIAFVAVEASELWHEWSMLQGDVSEAQRHAVIGFYDIAPIATYARAPSELYRQDGESTLLWSRWEHGVGHPTAHYISRAIDYPVVENNDGTIWRRLPPDARVVGHTLEGTKCVYPVIVLGKVEVINDIVADHPFLIVVNLCESAEQEVSIFDAKLGEHRVTMAATGYFLDHKPLLYDRGSESLWVEDTGGLQAIAGKHKREKLPRVAALKPISWSDWKSGNPVSRLLVGADRSRGVPNE